MRTSRLSGETFTSNMQFGKYMPRIHAGLFLESPLTVSNWRHASAIILETFGNSTGRALILNTWMSLAALPLLSVPGAFDTSPSILHISLFTPAFSTSFNSLEDIIADANSMCIGVSPAKNFEPNTWDVVSLIDVEFWLVLNLTSVLHFGEPTGPVISITLNRTPTHSTPSKGSIENVRIIQINLSKHLNNLCSITCKSNVFIHKRTAHSMQLTWLQQLEHFSSLMFDPFDKVGSPNRQGIK